MSPAQTGLVGPLSTQLLDQVHATFAAAFTASFATLAADSVRTFEATRRAGLITGTRETWLAQLIENLTGTAPARSRAKINLDLWAGDGVTEADLQRVLDYAERAYNGRTVEWVDRTYTQAFRQAAGRILERARREGWTRERYLEAMDQLGKRFGTEGASAHLETWWRTFVVSEGYSLGTQAVFGAHPTQNLYPYRMRRTHRDERVRPNHLALDGFVARGDHPVWQEIRVPLGWNCRCGDVYVSAVEAQRQGWTGAFPLGTEWLEARVVEGRWAEPGRDAGFR